MTTIPPSFGPTDPIPCDDDRDAFATVNLSLVVSREQLRAALAIGHAEAAGQPPLAELDILDVRREVEGYLAAVAVIGTEQEAATARISPELLAELDAAIDRAYTRPDAPLRMQQARYGDGTVTLDTVDRGEVTVPEPAWCIGHDGESVGYFTDITHNGPDIVAPIVTAKYGPSRIMTAHVSHAPHAEAQPEPFPLLAVELDGRGDLDPADVHALARALRLAATRVDRAAVDLEQLRRGMS